VKRSRLKPLLFGLLMISPLFSGCLSFHSGPLPDEPKTATFANVDGARVRYIDVGDGPPVVLLHGFASSLNVWEDLIREVQKTHRVLALDLKGFGWSDRPEGDYSPAAQAALVLHLMDARKIDRAAVVAHSWGASVALAMSLAAPERVTRLALYDAWVYEEQLPPTFYWARADGLGEAIFGMFYNQRVEDKIALAFFDKKYVTQKLVDSTEQAIDRPGATAAALAAVRGQRYSRVQERYKDVLQPTLLLWGREDKVTTLAYGERLSNELAHAKLVVYPRCGHFPMIEAKAPSTSELLSFLSSDPVPAPPSDPPHSGAGSGQGEGEPDAKRLLPSLPPRGGS
jgi:pimeloyl-ACP methyl ester carboxylesterase